MKFIRNLLLISMAIASLHSQATSIHSEGKPEEVDISIRFNDSFDDKALRPGDTGQIDYTILLNGKETSSRAASFGSNQPAVVRIDETGRWEALEPGVAEIGACYSFPKTDPALPLDPDTRVTLMASVVYMVVDNGHDDVFRLYNPNSGEHFYTVHQPERDFLVLQGWKYEGVAWQMPKESRHPIYRVYNPNTGDHHYTSDRYEVDVLVAKGWKDEGISFYNTAQAVSYVYRLYNPNASTGAHHFTMDSGEMRHLEELGWIVEENDWMPFGR